MNATHHLLALAVMIAMAVCVWALATHRRNAGIVDIFWPLFFIAAACVHAAGKGELASRGWAVFVLLAIWAARLSLYLTVRNWGEPEDRRYQAIRARNEPGFAWKSLYLVFVLQAVLAWIVVLPVAAALHSTRPLGLLDALGIGVVTFGILFQTVADSQLARFKADPGNAGRVMDQGLWRYSRHPNYFGECCIWWGFYALACSAGAAWTILSPLLMTVLLLKVSGVALLEQDIAERRPGYREYVARTNAFLPGPPRSA